MTETKPIYLDNPPEGIAGKVEELLTKSNIKPGWVDSAEDAIVTISWPDDRVECDEVMLYSGGYMTCPNAFKAAARMGLELPVFGELLNLLDVKLRQCQLGCF